MNRNLNPWDPARWSASESELLNPALPLITIGILNYNRCEDLRKTLDVIAFAIQYPRFEVIVVDNGSTDGSIEMVRSEYPSVRVHEIGKNLGVSSRNIQTQLARGRYLFSFDDDSFPGTPSTILRIVEQMDAHPEIDALSTSCYQPISGLMESKGWMFYRLRENAANGFEGIYIVEGGVCFRVNSLRKIDGYDPAWPYGCEGLDLGLQLYKAGFTIYFCPWFLTLHFMSPRMRTPGRRAFMNSRHMVWMIAKHWPLLAAIPLFAILISRRILAMLMHPDVRSQNMKGLIDGFKGIRPFFHYQPKLTWKQVLALKRFYLYLFRWA
jgi:GT2 family glycosyltransferase